MSALTIAQEYTAVRTAIQLLTTLDGSDRPRNIVSFSLDGMQVSYSADQLPQLQQREEVLAKRLSQRNVRKRVTPDFSGGTSFDSNYNGL